MVTIYNALIWLFQVAADKQQEENESIQSTLLCVYTVPLRRGYH